jgi:hypothetical protein
MEADTGNNNADNQFNWPTDPPQDWFEAKGAALGLAPETIRFAAALHSLGGADAKKNTQAARLAGLAWDRVVAFRAARSVGVRKLLDEAKRLKAGNLPPLTEADIDREIDDLIRQPDALTKARGIELREKRKDRQRQQGATPDDDGFSEWRICRDFLCHENGASQFMLYYRAARKDVGHPANYPLLRDIYDIAQLEPFGQQIFDWCGRNLSDVMRQALTDRLADPNYQKETRIKIWKEIGVDITAADKQRMRA